jgi:hypothetical protein
VSKKGKKSMPPRTKNPEDPNAYAFWLQPLPPFDVRYESNWVAQSLDYVGPFTFRAIAERERVDRLVSGGHRLKLVPGGKKEAP